MTGPDDADEFVVLRDGPEVEVKIQGSRFLGQAFSASDDEAARARLDRVRRRHHDATHHCHARRTGGPDAPTARFDDDGEPSGTAGRPILAALEGRDLHDALVVVTRYFGGTKLGTGGLARAYGEAAAAALAAAPVETRVRQVRVRAACDFDDSGVVEAVLARAGRAVLAVDRSYDPEPRFDVTVRRGRRDAVVAALVEATAGRVRVEECDGEDPAC